MSRVQVLIILLILIALAIVAAVAASIDLSCNEECRFNEYDQHIINCLDTGNISLEQCENIAAIRTWGYRSR